MRIGASDVFGGEDGRDAAFMLEEARHLERLGFTSLWLSEHFASFADLRSSYPYGPRSPRATVRRGMYDQLVALAAIATATSRLRLGTHISILPLRHPLAVAREVATLDHISGGRFDYGVGLGWAREEYEAMGVDWSTRGARIDEHLEALRACWTEEESAFHGRFVDFAGVYAYPKPVQKPHPPLLISGNSEASIRRIVAHGDGWLGYGLDLPDIEDFVTHLDAAMKAAGRGRDELTLRMGRPMRHESPRGWAEDAAYIRGCAELGIDEVICSIRFPTAGLLDSLSAYAAAVGVGAATAA